MDAWTRYSDHPTFRSFEVLHDPGDSGIVEVFAIHGLGSNPSSAWRHGGNGTQVYWLRDLLPKQKGLESIKVTMLNHQTRRDSHSPEVDFDVFAKMMLDDIEHLHQQNRPIIFIAHGFGGLLLKRTVNINSGTLRYAEDVLLDTDHRGLNKFQSSNDPNFEKFLRHFHHALRRDAPLKSV
ncbi:hypothetical protein QQX98_010916 [Neonectria punicea]|uniref:AB hydrolase-1 domain-containing protein n=1 Tax=Neonectria punicea TaxID=979145 RepID=A0ABR1GN70_9HYPO